MSTPEIFKSVLCAAGLGIKDLIVPDGRVHRFTVAGDRPKSKNGWYVLYADGLPAGAYGSWKRGVLETWCAKDRRSLSPAERQALARRMDAARTLREAEEAHRQKEAARKALAILEAAPLAPDDHPYLVRKRVRSYGLRLYNGALVVPVSDVGGVLHSLQFIDREGRKRFLSGGRITGCFFLTDPMFSDALCITEGYATGASIYEATGRPVAVAFNCGNLLAVAQSLRAAYPSIGLTICADNDTRTPGNPGLTKARQAAASVGSLLAVPPCSGDFNDFMNGDAA